MKKIIVPLLMILCMIGFVFADEAVESGAMFIKEKSWFQNLFSSFTPMTIVEFGGNGYVCNSEVDKHLTVNGAITWTAQTNSLCVTNSHTYPVVVQLFKTSGGQVGNDLQIMPSQKGCIAEVIGTSYRADVYYCPTIQNLDNCVDTDGGIDYYTQGYTSLADGSLKIDSCSSSVLTEYSCNSELNAIVPQTKDCQSLGYPCCDGHCLKAGEQNNCQGTSPSLCNNNGVCDSSETSATCANDCPGLVPTYPSLRECTDIPRVVEASLGVFNSLGIKISSGNTAKVSICLENIGGDMSSPWILEIQPQKPGNLIQSIIGFQENRAPCNISFPENQNKAFKLKSGERAQLDFDIAVPDSDISPITTETSLYAIITEYCGCTAESCYKSPFKAGEYLGNVAFGTYNTCASLNGTCKGTTLDAPLSTNLCGDGFNKLANKFECNANQACCVPIGTNETGCTPTQFYEDVKNEEVSEEDLKLSSAKSKSDCCLVNEKNRRLSFFTQDKFSTEFGYTMPTGFWSGLTQKFGVSEVGLCVNYPTSKDVTPSIDFCGWTSWAPEGFLGQCGNGYAISIIIVIVGYALLFRKKDEKGK